MFSLSVDLGSGVAPMHPKSLAIPPHGNGNRAASRNRNDRPIVFFDGECNLCNGTVQFILDRDGAGRFLFAPLQSGAASELLGEKAGTESSTMILLENGRLYERSSAALRIARHLGGLWPLAYALMVIPRPLRDMVYNFVARNRYRWFGKAEQCRLITPEVRERFLQDSSGG